ERMPQTEQLADRFNRQPATILAAATGTSLAYRDWLLNHVDRMDPRELGSNGVVARTLAKLKLESMPSDAEFLAAIKEAADKDQLKTLGDGFSAAIRSV